MKKFSMGVSQHNKIAQKLEEEKANFKSAANAG